MERYASVVEMRRYWPVKSCAAVIRVTAWLIGMACGGLACGGLAVLSGAVVEALPADGQIQPLDPSLDMRPAHQFAVLRQAQHRLRENPEDQQALGLALQAYCHLSIHGNYDTHGWVGPWHDYAIRMAKYRQQLRHTIQPDTFADELPQLWCDFVRGDTTAVVRGLDRWGSAANTLKGLTLRTIATGDFRLLKDVEGRNAQADLALIYAMESVRRTVFPIVINRDLQWPTTLARLGQVANEDQKAEAMAGVIVGVANVLSDPTVPSDVSDTYIRLLAENLSVEVDQQMSTMQIAQAIERQLQTIDMRVWHAQNFLIIDEACQAVADLGQCASDPVAPNFIAYGASDLARWYRDQSILWAKHAIWRYPGAHLVDPVTQGPYDPPLPVTHAADYLFDQSPSSMVTVVVHAENSSLNEHRRDRIRHINHNALRMAVADEQSYALTMLHGAVHPSDEIGKQIIVEQWRERYRGIMRVPFPLLSINRQNYYLGPEDRYDVIQEFAQMHEWYPRYWKSLIWHNAHLDWFAPRPEQMVSESIIENVAFTHLDDLPNGTPDVRWAAVISGELEVPQTGVYELRMAADDGARLRIAGQVLLSHRWPRVRFYNRSVQLTAGRHPLTLEWYQAGNKLTCEFEWRQPGQSTFETIPADSFSNGGQPGLLFRVYQDQNSSHRSFSDLMPERVQRAQRMPYVWSPVMEVGEDLRRMGYADQAYALIKDALTIYPTSRGLLRDQAANRLLQHNPDVVSIMSDMIPSGLITLKHWRDTMRLQRLIREQRASANILNVIRNKVTIGRGLSAHLYAELQLDVGNLQLAYVYYDKAFQTRRLYVSWENLLRSGMTWLLLSQVYAKNPVDVTRVSSLLQKNQCPDWAYPCYAYLEGALTFDQLLLHLESDPFRDRAYYFRALQSIVAGDHQQAQEDLRLVAAHAQREEAATADGLLAWYAAMSPAEIAKLPTMAGASSAEDVRIPSSGTVPSIGPMPPPRTGGGQLPPVSVPDPESVGADDF